MTSKIPENDISRKIWFKELIDPKKRCMNLRAYVKKVFGKKLEKNQYFALRDMLDPNIRNIYFSTARQCVDGDTLVILKNGKVLPIKNVKDAFKTGTQEVYAIKTKTGKYIECTLDHKFMTKHGWRTMRQIQKQNWFFEVPDYLPYPDNIKCNINDNRLKILGYLLSDGTGYLQYGQSIKFTNVSNLYLDDFEELVNIEFPNIKTTRYKKGNGFDITCTGGRHGCGTNIMQAWINSLTFNGGFVTELMACNEKQVACFLSRLFAGDGYTWHTERNYEIGLGDNDLYMIRYLQLLLQKFGIHGYYKKDNNYNMYRLRISNNTSIKRFFDLCLIFGKEEKCNEVLNKIKNVNTNRSRSGSIFRFPGYDKVSKIEFIEKKETYDMEVFPENMYYANGIKVHNSGKTETIAIYQALCSMFPDCVIPDYEGKGNCYVFAPKKEQAQISFERFSNLIHHNEYNIYSPEEILVDKADRMTFKNGFEVRAITASRNAEIEGLTTHIIILDESQAISPYKVRECLTGDTIIPLADGSYTTLKEVVDNKLTVLTPTGETVPLKYFAYDEDDIYEITLVNGKTLKCNSNHNHVVYHKNWRDNKGGAVKKLNTLELKEGQRLAMLDKLPYFGNEGDYEDGFIVGSFLGDGCLSEGTGLNYSGLPEEIDYLHNIINKKYNIRCTKRNINSTDKAFNACFSLDSDVGTSVINRNPLTKYFREIGIYGKTGENKEIPNNCWTEEFLKGLIVGLIETDGCVCPSKSTIRNGNISFDNISERMVKQLQNYLQKFGIHSRVSVRKNNGEFGYKNKPLWTLTIKAVEDIIRFYNTFTLVTKQDKLELLYNQRKNHEGRNSSKHYPDNFRFSRIKSIKKLDKKEKVYCVQVYSPNQWIVDGIISYQSILPMGGGVRGGAKIIQCGVPGILGSHFHKAFKNKYDKEDNPYGYMRHISPWSECPRLNEAYIMTLKAEDDESFERNYELDWARSNFGYFIEESQYDYCSEDYDPVEFRKKAVEEGWEMHWGIDFAKLRDSTVLTELAQNPKTEELYLVRLIELRGVDYTEQVGYFINMFNPLEVVHISCDQTAVGEPIVELMNAKSMRTTGEIFTSQFKDKMYKNLKHLIENKKIHWPTFSAVRGKKEFTRLLKRFKQQLMELEMEYKVSGQILYHHNLDDNLARDDYADSAALAAWSVSAHIPPSVGYAEDY